MSLDSIVNTIESAVVRDAQTRRGAVVYAIYFHLAGGQVNRGRCAFTVDGGLDELLHHDSVRHGIASWLERLAARLRRSS